MHSDQSTFEELVARAIDELPAWVRERMDNIDIVVQTWPSVGQLRRSGTPAGSTLLGLYEGVPLIRRGRGYNLVPPDRIVLFRGPLEQQAQHGRPLQQLIRRTVLHEIAHHFGFTESEIRSLGY